MSSTKMNETYEPIDEQEKEYRDEYLRKKQIHDKPEKDRKTELKEMDNHMHLRLAETILDLEDKLISCIKQFFLDIDNDLDYRLEEAMDEYELYDKPLWKIELEKKCTVDSFADALEENLLELITERIKEI